MAAIRAQSRDDSVDCRGISIANHSESTAQAAATDAR